jgi:hypothetical protein
MLNVVHDRPPTFATCADTIRVTAGERSRTGVNETKTETTVVELQATGSCLRAELNRWPMFSVIRQANRAHPSQTFAGDWLSV